MKKKISAMFKNLCCSRCKADFDENSVHIMRQEDNMFVIKLVCNNCGKSFGVAFLGISDLEMKGQDEDYVLNINDKTPPINIDDVIDAHKFIQDLDEHWQEHLP